MSEQTAVDKVLKGAVDLHCHSGPSPLPRRLDHAEAAQRAEAAGFRAILVKSHHHNTVMDLIAMRPRLASIKTEAFGGVALNSQVGGINPYAVEISLKMGGKAVWLPTISSRKHEQHHSHGGSFPTPEGFTLSVGEVPVLESGTTDLVPGVTTVLEMVAEADALLSGGHNDAETMKVAFDAARDIGVTRMVVSHPNFIIDGGRKDIEDLVELGAVIEHECVMYDPESQWKMWDIDVLLEMVEWVGVENSSLASDSGQVGSPWPTDCIRRVCELLLDSGLSEEDVRTMVVTNPTRLLGLDN